MITTGARPSRGGGDPDRDGRWPTPVAARLEESAGLLGAARRIVVLSGAGIPTESGIPTPLARGLWTHQDPHRLDFGRHRADPDTRRLAWRQRCELSAGGPAG
jgi:hypothetical protein